ncbi:hypothetical protein INR49_029485, partial [Caranx melampygus]
RPHQSASSPAAQPERRIRSLLLLHHLHHPRPQLLHHSTSSSSSSCSTLVIHFSLFLFERRLGAGEQSPLSGERGMDAAEGDAPLCPQERSSHTAFIDNNTLYVWGGYQVVNREDVMLPSDEIWLCDLDSGTWQRTQITGDVPPVLEGSCGAYVNGTLYIFAGCDSAGYTNQMFSVDLTEPSCTWKKVTDTRGTTPSPRNKHSCWVHRDRLIYFGGYGCKTIGEVRNTTSSSFVVEEMSWTTIGDTDISSSCSPLGRSMHTMTPISDHALFVYGGLGTDGNTLNDAWQFNTVKREWTKMTHPHGDKPRVCHTACLGNDDDVVVFGGSSRLCILMDSVAVLRAPSQHHCRDVIVFQTQPYSLFRLCEDFMGKNPELFRRQLESLPSKLRSRVEKRVAFFSSVKPVATA